MIERQRDAATTERGERAPVERARRRRHLDRPRPSRRTRSARPTARGRARGGCTAPVGRRGRARPRAPSSPRSNSIVRRRGDTSDASRDVRGEVVAAEARTRRRRHGWRRKAGPRCECASRRAEQHRRPRAAVPDRPGEAELDHLAAGRPRRDSEAGSVAASFTTTRSPGGTAAASASDAEVPHRPRARIDPEQACRSARRRGGARRRSRETTASASRTRGAARASVSARSSEQRRSAPRPRPDPAARCGRRRGSVRVHRRCPSRPGSTVRNRTPNGASSAARSGPGDPAPAFEMPYEPHLGYA